MTEAEAAEAEDVTPLLDGPDPRRWTDTREIQALAEDLRAADAMLELLDGKVARDGVSPAFDEARSLVRRIAAESADKLSAAILAAYGIFPDGEGGFATEAVGGFSGDSDSPGDRDHV